MAPSNGVAKPRSKQHVKPVVPLCYANKREVPAASTARSPSAAASLDQGIRPVTGGGNNGNGLSPADDVASELPSPPVDLFESSPVDLNAPGQETADLGLVKPPEGDSSSPPMPFYQMHPHFPPPDTRMSIRINGDLPHGPHPHPHNGPNTIHQANPSNGSIRFGTLHDSQGSSPAPPHSGGIAPPPGIAHLKGPYMGAIANGHPPNFGPMESFPPHCTNYGPSTPHSFHGSQSSGHPDDVGMYGHFPPGPHRNGGPVLCDDMHHQNAPPIPGFVEYSRMMHGAAPPPPMPPDNFIDGLLRHLQQQFNLADFADCTLELRYPEQRTPVACIPGHRLILCRSPVIASHLLKSGKTGKSGLKAGSPTVVLEIDGRWKRSDAFYTAVQRLYGLPLLPIPPPGRADSGDVVEAGSAMDQLDFCLSYAAAGRLLGLEPVIRRGCEVALHLLGWQTLETVLEFVMDAYADMGTHESFKYGDGSRILLDAVAIFIANNLPSSFKLDKFTENEPRYGRLPIRLPRLAPATAPAEASAPAMARGQSLHLGKRRRPEHIAHIQFGDMSVDEQETPKIEQDLQLASNAMFSRVLLELPYSRVKMLLESPLALITSDIWASRVHILKAVVEEREARRRRAIEAVVDGRYAVSDAVRTALSSPNPRNVGKWSLLGWQEEILSPTNPEGISLMRTWVPLVKAQNGSTSEYP